MQPCGIFMVKYHIFYNNINYLDEYEGLVLDKHTASPIGNAMIEVDILFLANHGIITTGETVADGFNSLYYFEKAAETYLTALSTNKELNIVSHEIAEKTAQETADYPINLARLFLNQIRFILDKEEPDYIN